MTPRSAGIAAFGAGLAAVAWVAAGYVGTSLLALAMTGLIAAFYVMGALELHRYERATGTLRQLLADTAAAVPDLPAWLARLDPALQPAVRCGVEGERVGLPAPSMTPYLVGLLVLLGMLGTFLGMVVTLNGAVMALESTTELATIRAALAAPVKGLGLAFGTSVAGVAASAMLGLMSALARRDRLQAAQALDACIATHLQAHTPAHERTATLHALQALATQIQRHGDTLSDRLTTRQDRFHEGAQAAYLQLASSVERSLKDSLAEGARAAGAALQPAVQASMEGIVRETAAFRQHLADALQQQLADVVQTLGRQSAALVQTVDQAHAKMQADAAARDEQRLAGWAARLDATTASIHAQAADHARATIAELSRLVATASEAPRAAAEVVAELRQRLSESMVHDQALLEERTRLMATLETLLTAVHRAATEQRAAVDALVASAADVLQRAGTQFGDRIASESERIAAAAAQVAAGGVEIEGLGAAFGTAVQMFSASSEALGVQMQRIEGALDKSTARSDEQLAYYVAQAREIVELSLSAQKQIVDDLQRLSVRAAPAVGEPA